MPIVGLTGSFGTGKTYVSSIFKSLGAKVIDADKLAHKSFKKNSAAYKKIIATLGRSILSADGSINRKALGRIVFNNKKRLAELNSIIHPGVIREIKDRIKSSKDEVLIIDAPLIFETGLALLMDVLVVVKASRKEQIKRCVKKFNISEQDVCKRMACQMPLKVKIERADYYVDNNGTRKETEKQVKLIWQELKKKKERRE